MDVGVVNVVCVGCTHGELDVMYTTVAKMEQESGRTCDIVLCCGDFQAVRDRADLESMAAPSHHLKMQDFHEYHSGSKRAPVLTVFIGGNHEASNHLLAMPLGGWVAHNIYFLGHAGVVTFMGLRIGGVSGIYKQHDADAGHWEQVRSLLFSLSLSCFRFLDASFGEFEAECVSFSRH
jgi:lariat debranching enzyme